MDPTETSEPLASVDVRPQSTGDISLFCIRCQAFLKTPVNPKFRHPLFERNRPLNLNKVSSEGILHKDVDSLFSSVELQCPLCVRIHLDLEIKYGLSRMRDRSTASVHWLFEEQSFSSDLTINLKIPGRELCRLDYELLSMTSLPPQPSKPIDASLVSTRSVSIKGLLDKCLQEHNCGRDRLPDYLPPRLLDCSLGCIRLVESKDIERGSHYATLSHCWGAKPPSITLRTDNFDLLHDSIRDELPATFADAVDICTRLNIRYMWIDSLCIIQSGPGHVEDWLNHVKQMVHIYRSCVVNIAAGHSEDSNGGCYSWRQLGLSYQCILPQLNYDLNKLSSRGISVTDLPQIGPYALFSRVNKNGNQELRICIPEHGYSRNAFCRLEYFNSMNTTLFGNFMKLNKDVDLEHLSPGEESRNYLRLQHIYSKTNLTRGEDRLAAYSSIAQLCCEATGDSYIAGYLLSELPTGLLWSNSLQYAANNQTIRDPYIAPTWSWASMERGWKQPSAYSFEPLQKTLYKRFSIQQYSSELVEKTNKYGPIRSASLQVECVLIHVQPSAQLEYYPWGGVYQMSFGSESIDLNIWWDEKGWSTSFTEVYFMPIRCTYNALVGIVLTPRVGSSSAFTSGTSKPPKHLRAGYSNVSDKENNGLASRKVLKYLESVPSQIVSLE